MSALFCQSFASKSVLDCQLCLHDRGVALDWVAAHARQAFHLSGTACQEFEVRVRESASMPSKTLQQLGALASQCRKVRAGAQCSPGPDVMKRTA